MGNCTRAASITYEKNAHEKNTRSTKIYGECLICWETIERERLNTHSNKIKEYANIVKCMQCNILMHEKCHEMYYSVSRKPFFKCPHCQYFGTLIWNHPRHLGYLCKTSSHTKFE
jgi:hypothetical protein